MNSLLQPTVPFTCCAAADSVSIWLDWGGYPGPVPMPPSIHGTAQLQEGG